MRQFTSFRLVKSLYISHAYSCNKYYIYEVCNVKYVLDFDIVWYQLVQAYICVCVFV